VLTNSFFSFQEYNPALRLKLGQSGPSSSGGSGTGYGSSGSGDGGGLTASAAALETSGFSSSSAASSNIIELSDPGVAWQYFDERSYISASGLKPGENAYARNKFNQEASDKLASNRDVPDTRSASCRKRVYPPVDKLPATSVIITFHNEARSTLLRTIVR
jgi:hypothetical protein